MPPEPPPQTPQTIDYASPIPVLPRTQMYQDGDELVVRIPGPPKWRLILLFTLRGIMQCALAGLLVLLCAALGAFDRSSSSILPLVIGDVALLFLAWLLISLLVRLVRLLRRPRISTEARASRARLTVQSTEPSVASTQVRSADIVDLSIREVSAAPVLARYVRLEIVLTEDCLAIVNIPWRGSEPLAYIEDNLRDAIGLKPR